MGRIENLENFEKEYYSEIKELEVTISELKKVGISDRLLGSEAYLYNIYGDNIIQNSIVDDVDARLKKSVTKIGEEDFNLDKGYRSMCGEIDDSDFDKNLDLLINMNAEK